ncbi:MAG: putative lipid II flippase FtsW [Candidatus Tectomicrobia bacterium]|nr:putative lipid II flippase FtsW [Candidatus Tectomicrobia bacterium]
MNQVTRQLDPVLLAAAALLTIGGVIMVFSSSALLAERRFGDPYFFMKRQLFFVALGVVGMLVLSRLDTHRLERLALPLLVVSLLVLILVLIPGIGHRVGGARRWLSLGWWRVQPAELAKLALVIYFARNLCRHQEKLQDLVNGFLPNALVLALASGLIALQPDVGNALLVCLLAAVLFVAAGMRLRHLGATLLLGLPLLAVLVASADYRLRRLLAFLDPWADPTGSGFQIVQSYLALGSGGVFGQGLGAGQQKLFFLPEAHTDFIFAIIGEELGFVGTAVIVLLFGVLLWRGAMIALRCQEPFPRFLAFGLTTLLSLQALSNMAVVVGLLPTKGLPLPFVSLGGSSLFMALAATGLLMGVARRGQ